MEQLADASQEEERLFPDVAFTFHSWMTETLSMKEATAKNYCNQLRILFEEDGKSFPDMASQEYFTMVKSSPVNRRGNNQRSACVKKFMVFWRAKGGSLWNKKSGWAKAPPNIYQYTLKGPIGTGRPDGEGASASSLPRLAPGRRGGAPAAPTPAQVGLAAEQAARTPAAGRASRAARSRQGRREREAAPAARALKRPASSSDPAPRPGRRAKLEEMPLSTCATPVRLSALELEAERVGFDAEEYLTQGYTVLKLPVLTESERAEALAIARRVRESGGKDNAREFVFMRGEDTARDKRVLFALLNKYLPFLHQLFSGIRLPGSDWSPYAHHNQIQVALKKPGFEGYDSLSRMYSAKIGHIDQPLARQSPEGKKLCNYSALFGIVLNGATADRDDAGNLFVAPGTHKRYAEAFQKLDGTPCWYKQMEEHYLDDVPKMVAVRAQPGQAVLMHHQTMHGVGPNQSDQDRVHIYFRVTAANRPSGCQNSFPEAMKDFTRESPMLRQLAEGQKQATQRRNPS